MLITFIKKYYVGGMISLICLPILFLVSTIESRKKAIYYGSIQVEMPIYEHYGHDYVKSSIPIKTYVFQGKDESEKIYNFRHYLENSVKDRKLFWKVELPEKCSYKFFIQTVDILQRNNFFCNYLKNNIVFCFRPEMTFQQEYESLSTFEEYQYVYSEISKKVSSLKWYFIGEPAYSTRILKYNDLGPPPGGPGDAFFTEKKKIKGDPKGLVYFQTIDLWFLPIIVYWSLLLVLSIKRSLKL